MKVTKKENANIALKKKGTTTNARKRKRNRGSVYENSTLGVRKKGNKIKKMKIESKGKRQRKKKIEPKEWGEGSEGGPTPSHKSKKKRCPTITKVKTKGSEFRRGITSGRLLVLTANGVRKKGMQGRVVYQKGI